jgi:ketosteroid isomerase-like protein
MKSVLAITFLLNAAPLAAQQAPDTVALRREIEQLNRGMEAAVNRGDLKGAAAFYADDAVVRGPRGVVAQGRASIDRYFMDIGKATWKLAVIQVGGDRNAPYQVGRSTLIHGARPDTSIVSFVAYWKRQPDGKLRILLDYYH